MTIGQSKLLFEKLHEDEVFRDRILAAEGMLDCMEIIQEQGFDCSMYELRMTMDKFISDNNLSKCDSTGFDNQ